MFTQQKFSEMQSLRRDLKEFLAQNKYEYLTQAQQKFIPEIQNNKNTVILAETGSGKTLSYLVPILNDIYNYYQNLIGKTQEEKDEYKLKNKKGALILTSSKQLTIQIYADLQKLDGYKKLLITRLGSISQHASYKKELDEQELYDIANQHLSNYCNFLTTDVIVTTPQQYNVLDEVKRIKNCNPKYIVIDEADQLFVNSNNEMKELLHKFKQPGSQNLDNDMKFVICAASLPKKIAGHKTLQFFQSFLPNLQIVKNTNYFKINPLVKHEVLDTDDLDFEQKCQYLLNIIMDSSIDQVVVFTKNENVQPIAEFLIEKNILTTAYMKNSFEQKKITQIHEFKKGIHKVLVCTDSLNRGVHFDFPVLVIQFDCANNIFDLVHRFGRTGRLGQEGHVITFLDENSKPLLMEFQRNLDSNEDIFLTQETQSELDQDSYDVTKSSYQTSQYEDKRIINFTEEKQQPKYIQSSKKQIQQNYQKFLTYGKEHQKQIQQRNKSTEKQEEEKEVNLDGSNAFYMQLYRNFLDRKKS